MSERTDFIREKFQNTFNNPVEPVFFSAPGRTELGGNHTDHQNGCVLAAAVDLDMIAAAAKNGTNIVNIKSGNYKTLNININELRARRGEIGKTAALIRGVCFEISKRGYEIAGFDAYIDSIVPRGSGLSSSAAFEVLIGTIINDLFCKNSLSPTDIAIIGQAAENNFFGKPCGLMDQMASSWGGVVSIDFKDLSQPVVKKIELELNDYGHSLFIIDVKSNHSGLTSEYAAITDEMFSVSRFFGKKKLRDVSEAEFFQKISRLRETAGDRAVLRAIHFFNENLRVEKQTLALERGDFETFLALVRESGLSSWLFLQNIVTTGGVREQAMAVVLALCNKLLGDKGASRVHGGGFGGTVQAFVPIEKKEVFKREIEKVLGAGTCREMSIRSQGSSRIK